MRTETLPAWRPRCRLSAGGCSPAASGRPAERREETVQSFRPELVVTDYTAGKTERKGGRKICFTGWKLEQQI